MQQVPFVFFPNSSPGDKSDWGFHLSCVIQLSHKKYTVFLSFFLLDEPCQFGHAMSPFLGHSLLTIMRVSSPLFSLTTGQKTCNETLGLESGKIENEALSASSSYDEHSTGPHNARYVHHLNLLGWPTFVACGSKKGFRIMQSYSIHSCANKTLQQSIEKLELQRGRVNIHFSLFTRW